MQSLSLKEKQLNEKRDNEARNILQKEMELSMKQNFLTQEADRYSMLFKIILVTDKDIRLLNTE